MPEKADPWWDNAISSLCGSSGF